MKHKQTNPIDTTTRLEIAALTAGYLPLVGGDIVEATRRALVAHTERIVAMREGITAILPLGNEACQLEMRMTLRNPTPGEFVIDFETSGMVVDLTAYPGWPSPPAEE